MESGLMNESGYDTVAIERGAKIISGNKKVLSSLLIRQHMS
jgi:hypothetical protein